MYWTAHVARLETALRESASGDTLTSEALAEVVDVVTDLIDLLLPHEDATVRNVGAASMHLAFAREHVKPAGPSSVPGNLPVPIAFRDARALLTVALETLGVRDRTIEVSPSASGELASRADTVLTRARVRNHLRAAARALGREVVLPGQRGNRGARAV